MNKPTDEQSLEVIRFGLDGNTYEIELPDSHATEFRAAFEPYVVRARQVGRDTDDTRGGSDR
jgi:hypothetical protein